MFSPLWNRILDGFGIHDPGKGRHKQKASSWDILHPGRSWTTKLKTGRTTQDILQMLEVHFKSK
jgi:hypothetical protein